MANYCCIHTYIPLKEVPSTKERNYLEALYKAKQAYDEASQKDQSLRVGMKGEEFIASQPGVPTKLISFTKPKGKQHKVPAVSAHFKVYEQQIYVCVYQINEEEGITIKPFDSKYQITTLEMSKDFRYSYPWWVELCFASGKKICEKYVSNNLVEPPEHQPYLTWETTINKALENLEFAIDTHAKVPVKGFWYQYRTFFYQMSEIEKFYRWLKGTYKLFPTAITVLDYAEVNMLMRYKQALKDNTPNELLEALKNTERDVGQSRQKKIDRVFKDEKYTTPKKRNPFDGSEW